MKVKVMSLFHLSAKSSELKAPEKPRIFFLMLKYSSTQKPVENWWTTKIGEPQKLVHKEIAMNPQYASSIQGIPQLLDRFCVNCFFLCDCRLWHVNIHTTIFQIFKWKGCFLQTNGVWFLQSQKRVRMNKTFVVHKETEFSSSINKHYVDNP